MLDRLPIRWRLALLSAGLTFAILCAFSLVVGELTQRRIRSDFNHQVSGTAEELAGQIVLNFNPRTGAFGLGNVNPEFFQLVRDSQHAVVRIVDQSGHQLTSTRGAPQFPGIPHSGTQVTDGYRVETRAIEVRPYGTAYIEYARPLSEAEATVRRVRLFLLVGVLGGTALALLGGVILARRAMSPIAELTAAAEEVRRTRDPGLSLEIPTADDEIAKLAHTLDEMLHALDESQTETAAALARQREFVADASHELRTPLTSVLANLELLAETLHGDQREAAESALRSSHRMRRLVADLLMLARADQRRAQQRSAFDLGEVLVDAAAEVQALGHADHELTVEAEPVQVEGVRDDLTRVALNLIENALRHTPAGTHVRASVRRRDGQAELVVEDDGPGVAPELRDKVFDRFVRGSGDGGRSFGLGLAIVRAVAEQHGGTVRLEDAAPGARFVVSLPAVAAADREAAQARAA